MSATIASIATAEATLVASLNATADALDAVGTGSLASALARVQASAEAAKARLSSAAATVHATLAGVLAHVEGLATGVNELVAPAAISDTVSEMTPPAPACSTCSAPEAAVISTPAGPVCEACDAEANPDVCDLGIDPAELEVAGLRGADRAAGMPIAVPGVPVAAFGPDQTATGSPVHHDASCGQPEANGRHKPRRSRK